ncbi:MAG: S10 family peptidase [Phycisphaerales bacterium]
MLVLCRLVFTCFAAFLLAPASATIAQAQPTAQEKPADPAAKKSDPSITHHSITMNGEPMYYTATAGYMAMTDYEGKPKANVFYVAYTRDDGPPAAESAPAATEHARETDPASRPITFAFNGGPGSSSVWLHLGALGPRRVVMDKDGFPLPPPYSLVDNEHSWLDATDLVFIDPVSTGYSRPTDGESSRQFHGLNEDIESVGDFIRLYTTRNKRWASPKFLAGESYGTTRAAGLSGYLQDTFGMYLNGVILISPVLNFATIRSATGNDLTYPMFLPTMTATAWYHNKLAPDLQADLIRAVGESRSFAINDYFTILARGDTLTPAERDAAVKKLSRLTGLSERYVSGANLRINEFNFMKELLRDDGYSVGRLDSRFKGIDASGVGDGPDYDPSMAAITGPYSACLNDYVRRELQYENDQVYEILTGRVQPWSYASSQNRYVNVGETLRGAMTRNQNLRVFVGSGFFDFATPMLGAEYTISHLGLHESLRPNISIHYYEAGHMMYIRLADLMKLKADVADFIKSAIGK